MTISGFSVEVDQYCDTCTSGGVKILGLHAATAPRRHDYHQPVTETYSFVPYRTDTPVQGSESVQQYASQCLQCASQGLLPLLEMHRNSGLKNKQHIRDVLRSMDATHSAGKCLIETNSHGYLSVLQNLFKIEYNEKFVENVDKLITESSESLKMDPLLNILSVPAYLKPCLDLVVENTLVQNLKIVEVSGLNLSEHLMPLIASHPLLQASFSIATVNGNESIEGVEVLKWSPQDKPPQSLQQKLHLVIADNVLHNQPNIQSALCNIAESLDSGGFLLVKEYTRNYHLALPLDGFFTNDSFDDLSSRSCSIYLSAEKWREIFVSEGFEIIFERSDFYLNSLFLLRKVAALSVSPKILAVSNLDCSWVDSLKEEIGLLQSKPKGECLWLTADNNVSGIMGLVNCLRQEPGGERIRLEQ